MSAGFWLSDRTWAAIEPLLPSNEASARLVDDRRVISEIIHVLRIGCQWKDYPPDYGQPTTIYNRFNQWSHRGLWGRIFAPLLCKRNYRAICVSTAPPYATIAPHTAGKGGESSGHRVLAWRANHQNPRPDRWSRANLRLHAQPWHHAGVGKRWGSCGAFSFCDGQPPVEDCGSGDGNAVSPFGRPPHCQNAGPIRASIW